MRAVRCVLSVSLFLVASAQAALVELQGTPVKVIQESGVEVPVYGQARVTVGQGPTVRLTGAGLRVKKVVLMSVNVYVAVSYAESPAAVTPADPLAGLAKSGARALRLTFLRDVSADQVRDAFGDSLKENGVDPTVGPVAEALKRLAVAYPKQSTLTLVGLTTDKGQELHAETPSGSFSVKGASIVGDFWKIWFGKPADGGIEKLKASLVSGAK